MIDKDSTASKWYCILGRLKMRATSYHPVFQKDEDVHDQRQRKSVGPERDWKKVGEMAQKGSFSEMLEREVDSQYPEVIEIN